MTSSHPPAWLNPTHPPLSGEEAKAAVSSLISDKTPEFTKIIRSQTDEPVTQQSCGLVSWMLFSEPRKLASGKPVYGFIKLRGNYADSDLCKKKAADIIRNQDSRNKINVLPIGSWLPITDDDGLTKETINVQTEEDPLDDLREKAAKEKEKEQQRIMREIKEREEEVKNAKDYNDDTDHLDYYTMKRVTWMRLVEEKQILQKKIESVEEKVKETRKLLFQLEKRNPGHLGEWIDHYNKERRKAKIPDYIPSAALQEEYARYLTEL